MTHKELREKHGLKEYDVTLQFRCDEPWHERNEAGKLFPAAVGFNTFQANKTAAVAAGLNHIGSQGFQLKDIVSIEVEEKEE